MLIEKSMQGSIKIYNINRGAICTLSLPINVENSQHHD